MPDIIEQFIFRLNGIAMIMEICFIILDVCIIMFYAVAWACYIYVDGDFFDFKLVSWSKVNSLAKLE